MENWRKRWEQLTEDVAIEGYLPNGEMASDSDIEDFISEELDKAREEEREKMVRIQFPKTIQRIEQEAERRGAINILKKVRDSADGLYDEDRDWHEVLYGVLEAELKLLEEENGKQNAR